MVVSPDKKGVILVKELRDVAFGIPQSVANKIGALNAESLLDGIMGGGSLEDSLNDLTAEIGASQMSSLL